MIRNILFSVLFLTSLLLATSVFAGLVDNGDGTVTDASTKLMWLHCSFGLSGADCATGTAIPRQWEVAIWECENLSFAGFTDWRLPTVKELRSILDTSQTSAPLIDTGYFPNTQSDLYATCTGDVKGTESWYVSFGNGFTLPHGGWMNSSYIRCVRGCQ